MVLAELGRRIADTIVKCTSKSNIDESAIDKLLDEICDSLRNADVNIRIIRRFRDKVRHTVVSEMTNTNGGNKRQIVESAVVNELVRLVDPGVKSWQPVRARSNVIMFVGLQGSGKTTSVTKIANHYQNKGWKTSMVCADTYRAGAYDQLKQNATKARIPYYGSYSVSDPVQIAREGVEKFRAEQFEIILIDTSGRHRQDEALFEEMLQISNVISPDNIIYVMDATNGQSCESHARAFKAKVDVASIVVTKLDGHAKGGGAISGVAATHSPIVFIGTGEHLDQLEEFKVKNFVQKMLGMGDLEGLLDRMKDVPIENQQELASRFERGLFTLRDLYEYLQLIQKLGPIGQLMRSIPNIGNLVRPGDVEGVGDVMRRCLVVLDSMSSFELDCPSGVELFEKNPSRRQRVARGAGVRVEEVDIVLNFHQVAAPKIQRLSGFLRNGMGSLFGGSNRPSGGGTGPLPMEPSSLLSSVFGSSVQSPISAGAGERVTRQSSEGSPLTELVEFDLD